VRALRGPSVPHDDLAERILNACRVQLVEFGLRRTSIDDVARRAGVGRMTLYRRFAGRDALVTATLLREARAGVAEVLAAVEAVDDPAEQCLEGFLAGVRVLRSNPLGQRLLETDPDIVLPFATAHAGPVLAVARAVLTLFVRQAQARGSAAAGDPEHVAELLARLALSLVLTPSTSLPVDDEAALRATARRTLLPLVTGCP